MFLPAGLSPGTFTHITSKYNRPVRLGVSAPFTSGESSPRKALVTQLVKRVKDSVTAGRTPAVFRPLAKEGQGGPFWVSTISQANINLSSSISLNLWVATHSRPTQGSGAVTTGVPEVSGTRPELQAEQP